MRTSRSLSGRADQYNSGFFIKHKRELTTLPILRYSSGHKKGGLKILSVGGQPLPQGPSVDYALLLGPTDGAAPARGANVVYAPS